MKRTLIVAIVVASLLLGVTAYAFAASQNVTVNARVNPKFEMTLSTDGTVDFGTIDPGAVYTAAADEEIRIKSNEPWDFTAPVIAETWDGQAASTFLTLTTTSSKDGDISPGANGLSRGASDLTCDYELDLTGDAAWELAPETDYSATLTYTAVQQ
jgi:hypothetical protein